MAHGVYEYAKQKIIKNYNHGQPRVVNAPIQHERRIAGESLYCGVISLYIVDLQ